MDIVELILADHHEQRRMFALLDEIGNDPDLLQPVWKRLSVLLEVHADAEERLFYPRLLEAGEEPAARTTPGTRRRTPSVITTTSGTASAGPAGHPVGSREWWLAVTDTRSANSDHMGEEEREALADFRRHASLRARHELGVQFAAYEAAHAAGVPLEDKDPDRYVRRHSG